MWRERGQPAASFQPAQVFQPLGLPRVEALYEMVWYLALDLWSMSPPWICSTRTAGFCSTPDLSLLAQLLSLSSLQWGSRHRWTIFRSAGPPIKVGENTKQPEENPRTRPLPPASPEEILPSSVTDHLFFMDIASSPSPAPTPKYPNTLAGSQVATAIFFTPARLPALPPVSFQGFCLKNRGVKLLEPSFSAFLRTARGKGSARLLWGF